jgi:hypothetical protein
VRSLGLLISHSRSLLTLHFLARRRRAFPYCYQTQDQPRRRALPEFPSKNMVFGHDCTNVPESTQTDAGVAGAGTLLSFIITNFISFLLSGTIILLGLRKSTSAPICRKLLQSFSDQQILTGIGIQSVGLAKMKYFPPRQTSSRSSPSLTISSATGSYAGFGRS